MTTMMTEPPSSSETDRAEYRGRHWARRLALQALYQWDMSGEEVSGLLDQFSRKDDILRANTQYFEQLVRGVVAHEADLCKQLTRFWTDQSSALTQWNGQSFVSPATNWHTAGKCRLP